MAAVIFPLLSREGSGERASSDVGEGAVLAGGSSILIVEQSDEVREVLRIALARRGVTIYETSRADVGLELARRHNPKVIVLDLDAPPHDFGKSAVKFGGESDSGPTPVILLGSVRRDCGCGGQFVAKPYHYQSLISKIEQLLESRRAADAA